MNNSPTHDAISQRAYQLWQNAGQPDGRHDEFWHQAESELRNSGKNAASDQHPAETPATPSSTIDPALKEVQKKEARAPQVPHTSAPKHKPAPTGKPLYDKPHSA